MINNRMHEGFKRFGALTLIAALLLLFVLPGAHNQPVQARISATAAGADAVASNRRAIVPQISEMNAVAAISPTTAGAAKGANEATRQRAFDTLQDARSELKWLNGSMQVSEDNDCFEGTIIPITSAFVSYWGSEDGTSPKVGDVFYGRVVVGGVGNACSGPYAHLEVIPPPGTSLAIDSTNKVHCSVGNFRDPKFTELPESECPQSTWKGAFGSVLDRPTGLPWDVSGGRMVIVTFPLVATSVMTGEASDSWLKVGVHSFDGWLSPWTSPKKSLYVADNPPSIQYDSSVTTSGSTAKTSATLFNHYKAGKAYFEIGTTTRYDFVADPIQIKANANEYNIYESWHGLEPGVTYHWRVRFVTADGKTYTGGDRSFVAGRAQPTPSPSATPTRRATATPRR